jgi:copper chaperone CopZ
MRLAILLLAPALAAHAEFARVEVTFQGTECLSCTESLQGRLERVRGVETVAVDLERSIVTMDLETGNNVRLAPLLSRITQDGTKISRIEVVVTGTVARQEGKLRFHPDGLREAYRLQHSSSAPKPELQSDSRYEIRGTVSEVEPGAEAVIEILSAAPAAGAP